MIDRSKITKTITIQLGILDSATQINEIMQANQITRYVYAFITNLGVMKIGSSKDNEWSRKNTYGDRIYRQAHYLPGWPTKPIGSSGRDFLPTIQKFGVTRKDVWIRVWDMSDYPFAAQQFPKEVEEFENELIQEYTEMWGSRPYGNPKDTARAANVTVVGDTLFGTFFEKVA